MSNVSYIVDAHHQSLAPITELAHKGIVESITSPFFSCSSIKVYNLKISKNKLISILKDSLNEYADDNQICCFNRTSTNFQLFQAAATDFFINIMLDERNDYVRYSFTVLSYNETVHEELFKLIESAINPFLLEYDTISIRWYFSSNQGIDYSYFEEKSVESILSEAYPYVAGGIESYVNKYINSKESVLILIGSPGTGKTSLIRYIISQYMKTKKKNKTTPTARCVLDNDDANGSVYYTADTTVLERDDMFISFATNQDGIMVMEDIDLHLTSRSDGNVFMYKLLGASDGLMKNINRKIIISTNLSNVKDIDDALIRPGRCFDVLNTKKLLTTQCLNLLSKFEQNETVTAKTEQLKNVSENTSFTLAELYSDNLLVI